MASRDLRRGHFQQDPICLQLFCVPENASARFLARLPSYAASLAAGRRGRHSAAILWACSLSRMRWVHGAAWQMRPHLHLQHHLPRRLRCCFTEMVGTGGVGPPAHGRSLSSIPVHWERSRAQGPQTSSNRQLCRVPIVQAPASPGAPLSLPKQGCPRGNSAASAAAVVAHESACGVGAVHAWGGAAKRGLHTDRRWAAPPISAALVQRPKVQ